MIQKKLNKPVLQKEFEPLMVAIAKDFSSVRDDLKDIRQNMATKEDIKGIRQEMATKVQFKMLLDLMVAMEERIMAKLEPLVDLPARVARHDEEILKLKLRR